MLPCYVSVYAQEQEQKKEGLPVSFCLCVKFLSPFADCYSLLVFPSFTVSSPWTKLPTMKLGKICAGQAKRFHHRGEKREYQVINVEVVQIHDEGGDVEGGDVYS